MSLERRARLARKTPLVRTRLARNRAARMTTKRPTPTGPSAATRQLVWARAGGCCELCGADLTTDPLGGHSIHHRHPRRMGGTRREWINSPTNLMLLCGTGTSGCHGYVEAHRVEANGYGWLLREGQSPAALPILIPAPGRRRGTPSRLVWLSDAGTYLERPERG